MKPMRTLALTVALGLASAAALHAQDAQDGPTTKPSRSTKGPRVIKPFANLTDLTFEQRTKIAAIHKQALADKKKIEDKEMSDCMDLLTPDQKDTLEKSMDSDTAKRKGGKAEATSEPAGM